MDGQQSPPTAQSVGFTLSSLGLATSAAFTAKLAPLGLTPRDFALMRSVAFAEGLSQQAIAERLQIPPSRLVAFIDGLEQQGMVERRSNPEDRRARALYLTAAGKRRLARALKIAQGFEQDLCGDLSAGERKLLLELLHRVGARLGVAPGVHAATADQPGSGIDAAVRATAAAQPPAARR
ncbi:MAG TPA: MarR family transcriptional regulator [Solirubrobacteraceae bacterium]|jgi:DNA-binding MarR family transcriptional regulator